MPVPEKQKTFAVVGDGRKCLILENTGPDWEPKFMVIDEIIGTPKAQTTGPSGRRADTGQGQRSAMEVADAGDEVRRRLAASVADRLGTYHRKARFQRLMLAAPPAMLGALRTAMPGNLTRAITLEFPSDLVHHTVDQIDQAFQRAKNA